jgi:hypothetical protein
MREKIRANEFSYGDMASQFKVFRSLGLSALEQPSFGYNYMMKPQKLVDLRFPK